MSAAGRAVLNASPPRPPRQAMTRPCYSALLRHAPGGKPALVFAPSRRHARLAALELMTLAAADGEPHRWARVCLFVCGGGQCLGRGRWSS